METSGNATIDKRRNDHTTAAFLHLSTFLKYCIPFANYIAPILIWTYNKDSDFVDKHGKQAINFQLSVLVYAIVIGLVSLLLILFMSSDFILFMERIDYGGDAFSILHQQNLSGYILLAGVLVLVIIVLFIFELYAVINASIHASRGQTYQYPLCIPFIKTKTH